MFFLLKLLAATLIAASAYASSNDTVPPLKITALKIRKHAYANVSIVFAVDDPDPLTNSTALCAGSWAVHSKGYPQGSYVSEYRGHDRLTARLMLRRSFVATASLHGIWRAIRVSDHSNWASSIPISIQREYSRCTDISDRPLIAYTSVGEAPYDVITNFAKVVVEEPSLECKAHSGVHKCAQGHETIIEAPIWATIAKLR